MKDLSMALESSCDETSIAILSQNQVLFEQTLAQDSSIQAYGGIFPEMIARTHIYNFLSFFNKINKSIPNWKERLARISYTFEPGFIGSLVISKCIAEVFSINLFGTAKALIIDEIPIVYKKQKICLIKINHLDGHIYSPFILKTPPYPFISAIISGGHTHIYLVKAFNVKTLLTKTRDDSIGEAYDKIGRIFGVSYPWGKNIDKLTTPIMNKVKNTLNCKSPLLPDGSFSFSGIKTKLVMAFHKSEQMPLKEKQKLLAEFQKISQEAIYTKVCQECQKYNVNNVAIGGGVASNTYLRQLFSTNKDVNFYSPKIHHCTDNATMIANVTWQALKNCIK